MESPATLVHDGKLRQSRQGASLLPTLPRGEPLRVIREMKGGMATDEVAIRSGRQPPLLALDIIASASSMVKEFGFWIGGNSLNVAANLSASAHAPYRM
jgi:hypothetical protein